ncbi:MAG TPA: CGNR zinc finger domain-containing protein [Symbiobacteriaceae bacterium]|nr:CGNR zinc finger domain-containing protein [Symbiobacteriaceae bacterium]
MDLLWTSFINSHWHDWRGSGKSEDRLDKPDWIARFLTHWQLPVPAETTPADIEALKALRGQLLEIAQAMAKGELPSRIDHLNDLLARGPVVRRLEPAADGHRLRLDPHGTGWPQIHAEIAASLAETLTEGESSRVRICDNPDCLWVFYDDTRNRTKRFCDDKACGNLMKVRRFRARKRAESD